jgi:hypothetical protein
MAPASANCLKTRRLYYFTVLTGRSVPARRFFMTFGGGLANGPSVRSKPAYSFRHFSYSAGSTQATRSASAMGLPSAASASITRSLSRISLGLSFRLATWRAPETAVSDPHRHPALCRDTDILNLALARLKSHGSGAAIVFRGDGRPRARDLVGVITKRAIADAVIENLAD